MPEKRIGAIKIDWFNMRVEFSPNINIQSKKSQSITGGEDIEETVINFTIPDDNISTPKYKTYVLSSDSIEDDEPFELDNPWYKDLGSIASSASPTPSKSVPSPSPAIQAPSPKNQEAIQKIEAQINAIQQSVQELDKQFNDGKLDQDSFVKKKDYLAQKMGTLMGKLETLKNN